jgi:phospholipase D1/2
MEQRPSLRLPLDDFSPVISKKQVLRLTADDLDAASVPFKSLCFQFEVQFTRFDTEFRWTITRSYSEFKSLSRDLRREAWQRPMPKAPTLPSSRDLQQHDNAVQLEMLETYLVTLSGEKAYCESSYFWAFLEVSIHSFSQRDVKLKEGYIQKRTGGKAVNEKRCLECSKHFKRFQRRWMIVTPDAIGYITTNESQHWHESLMFKNKFVITSGAEATGYEDGIKIDTARRLFFIRTGSVASRVEWVEAITAAYDSSEWNTASNINGSSFPLREYNLVKSFVDAEGYYAAVHRALLKAKHHVFISDWWLSPEMYLLRPASEHPDSQLVKVLRTIAQRGVHVYVHVYKELALALTLNSLHTIKTLRATHANIRAIRHPHRSITKGEFLWSHHEKLVVVDYKIAFLGGLDLCYGRFDTSEHRLVDNGKVPCWNGIDYSNSRVADFTDVANWNRDSIDRFTTPRMPWHDIAMQVKGKAASDVALHFIELWNHVMTDMAAGYYKSKQVLEFKSTKPIDVLRRALVPVVKVTETEEEKSRPLKGDVHEASGFEEPFELTVSRVALARSKTVDRRQLKPNSSKPAVIHTKSSGFSSIDVERLDNKLPKSSEQESYLLPISEAAPRIQGLARSAERKRSLTDLIRSSSHAKAVAELIFVKRPRPHEVKVPEVETREQDEEERKDIKEAIRTGASELIEAQFLAVPIKEKLNRLGNSRCQLLRSGGLWSLGLEQTEHSIHTAYLKMISEAEHFIYIENQFFISSTAGDPVKNQIAQALVDRILVAEENQQPFRVIVTMPLLPAFEGAVDDPSASVLRVQLYWEYKTICRGESSLYSQLKSAGIKHPKAYIRFYGLRTHSLLGGTPQTEIVYIHSKLMIVDDTTVIIGSANINDRSMLGFNDSEIAMQVDDAQVKDTILAGYDFQGTNFAYNLRMQIFQEMSGCSNEAKLKDPFSDSFREEWDDVAEVRDKQRNTVIYRHIFHCYPDDSFKSIPDLAEAEPRLELYEQYSSHIQGFLVEFPMEFLCNEDLRISIFKKEYYVPDVNFV